MDKVFIGQQRCRKRLFSGLKTKHCDSGAFLRENSDFLRQIDKKTRFFFITLRENLSFLRVRFDSSSSPLRLWFDSASRQIRVWFDWCSGALREAFDARRTRVEHESKNCRSSLLFGTNQVPAWYPETR